MSELIFCCPRCLAIGSAGATIDDQSVVRSAHARVSVTCRECRKRSRIAIVDFLFSDSFLGDGTFMRLDRTVAA